MHKHKAFFAALFAAASLGMATAQTTPSATVTLSNGVELTFTTWNYNGVTGASLDDVNNEDGKVVVIPDAVTIDGSLYDVTMIGAYSFYGSPCAEVVIPSTTTDIYYSAFDGCQMHTITIGEGVDSVFSGAFINCTNLQTVNWNAAAAYADDSYAFGYFFDGCTNLNTINFGSDVQVIDGDIFFGLINYSALSSINIAAERLLPVTSTTFGYGSCNFDISVPCSQLATYQQDAVWPTLGTITANCTSDTTAPVSDTIIDADTLHIVVRDTIHTYDTLRTTIYDTVLVYVDTFSTIYDTIIIYDTIVIHDTVYIDNTTSISPTDASSPIKVYQHADRLVVEGATTGDPLRLFDLQGRQLMSATIGSSHFEVSVPAGFYLVQVGRRPAHKVRIL